MGNRGLELFPLKIVVMIRKLHLDCRQYSARGANSTGNEEECMGGRKEEEINNLKYLANGTDRKFRANSRLSLFFDRRC